MRLYGTQQWRRRSQAQLRREPLCRFCLTYEGRYVQATVADHIVPHKGDARLFWKGELQSLCKPCHDSLKAQQERGGRIAIYCKHGLSLDPSSEWHCSQCTGGGPSTSASNASATAAPASK